MNEIKVILFTIYTDGSSLFNPKFNDVQTLRLQGRLGNEAEKAPKVQETEAP